MPSAVILGSSGAFGSLFTRALSAEGWSLVGIDLVAPETPSALRFVCADVTALSSAAKAAIAETDHVIVSLPETVALDAADSILAEMREDALWVDLVAVKGRIVDVLARAPTKAELISVHPLFAPESGFSGQPLLAIDVRPRERARAFLALLESWGMRVTFLAAADHDRHLASVQVATHAALLSFGAALADLDYDVAKGMALGTKPHRSLVTLLARVLSFNPDAYWEVQESNPHAPQVRRTMRRALEEIDQLAERGDIEGFRASFDATTRPIAPKLDELADSAARLFRSLDPVETPTSLPQFRRRIDEIDVVLLDLLGTRLDLCRDVARFKRANGIPMMQPGRVEEVRRVRAESGVARGLDPAYTTRLYDTIIGESCRIEDEIIDAPSPDGGDGG